LRIGKLEAEGEGMEGDGMYHHYITLWMFALCQLGRATGEKNWVEWALELGVATSRLFVRDEGGRKRMVWKVGTDGRVLVGSEGHLDAATGYVIYVLVASTAKEMGMGEGVLATEIEEYGVLTRRHGEVSASGMCWTWGWDCGWQVGAGRESGLDGLGRRVRVSSRGC
jgi:hypothetical protein